MLKSVNGMHFNDQHASLSQSEARASVRLDGLLQGGLVGSGAGGSGHTQPPVLLCLRFCQDLMIPFRIWPDHVFLIKEWQDCKLEVFK